MSSSTGSRLCCRIQYWFGKSYAVCSLLPLSLLCICNWLIIQTSSRRDRHCQLRRILSKPWRSNKWLRPSKLLALFDRLSVNANSTSFYYRTCLMTDCNIEKCLARPIILLDHLVVLCSADFNRRGDSRVATISWL
jgi:hypothetical protein